MPRFSCQEPLNAQPLQPTLIAGGDQGAVEEPRQPAAVQLSCANCELIVQVATAFCGTAAEYWGELCRVNFRFSALRDECREVPVDAWLRLDQHGVVDHVEREPLERVVGVAEREVRPDLQHGTAAPRPRERRDAVQEAPFCPVWTREADAGDV